MFVRVDGRVERQKRRKRHQNGDDDEKESVQDAGHFPPFVRKSLHPVLSVSRFLAFSPARETLQPLGFFAQESKGIAVVFITGLLLQLLLLLLLLLFIGDEVVVQTMAVIGGIRVI